MVRRISYLVMAAVLINGLQVYAKDIHVNNATGHDRNLGQSPESADGLAGPVKTIARAVELSGQGDRIILAPTETPYRETVCLFGKRQSGDEFGAFTIEGNGAILDGSELVPVEVWRHAFGNTFRFRPTKFTYFQFFESGQPLKRIAVEPGAKTPPSLAEMEWCICNGFLYVCLENFKRPQDYRFTYSEKMTGMTIMQTDGVRINDLIVQGYQVDGISIVNNTKNVVLDNVIVRGNGRNGLTVGAASTASVGFSLFGDNNAAQIAMSERSELLLFLSEMNGTDDSLKSTQSQQVAQFANIVNDGGTLRRVGPDGVTRAEATQKPDIANLWGKLVPVSDSGQSTPPSTLTSTRIEPDADMPLSREPLSRELTPMTPEQTTPVEEPAPQEPQLEQQIDEPGTDETDSLFQDEFGFGDADDDNPFGL